MFIAHLPAGYLLTRSFQKRLKTKQFFWIGLAASILPDIDLFYFFFIDHRQTLHHSYWMHLPMVWIVSWFVSLGIALLLKKNNILIGSTIFFSNIFLHFILDTYVGGIYWFYPFVERSFSLFTVPTGQSYWVNNFIFHWTFLVEVIISLAALWMFVSEKKRKSELLSD